MRRLIRSTPAAALLGAIPAVASAQPYYWRHPMMADGGWPAMMFGWIFMFVPLVLLIAAVAFVMRWSGSGRAAGPQQPTALDILKERFARGEIDKTEYEERRRVLTGS
jgi:putative membrane protein